LRPQRVSVEEPVIRGIDEPLLHWEGELEDPAVEVELELVEDIPL